MCRGCQQEEEPRRRRSKGDINMHVTKKKS
jgi:hypothetical protein